MTHDLTLAADFIAPTREEWVSAVGKALKGADFDRTLVSRTDDGIRIEPLYTSTAVAAGQDEAGLPGFDPLLRGATATPRPAGRWDVRTSIGHPDARVANGQALQDLAAGATSVEFVVADPGDVPQLIDGIVVSAAPVVLRPTGDPIGTARAFLDRAPRGALGCLGIDPATADLSAAAEIAVDVAAVTPGIRTVLVTGATVADAGASEGQEIGYLLAAGTSALRALTQAGLDLASAARQIAFEATADVDIFATVAKLRALRRSWAAVLQESGLPLAGDHTGVVSISAVSSYRTLTVVDPWVNLLRGTASCLGAVLGGADAVTIAPFDSADALPGDLGRRLARNTQLILAQESGIGRVIDPVGGSWYVETLTDQMAAQGWAAFGRLESAGSLAAGLAAFAEEIGEVAAARDLAIARRKRPITGVSEFPLLGEQRPQATGGAPARPASLLPRRRLAEPLESLRAAGEAAGASVFLANLGPVAVHTARATFAANLFAVGGIASTSAAVDAASVAEAFGASGARVACICSSDAVYAEQAQPVAAALRAAGARRIYLAGKAEVSGVDETVALGCNALDVLTRLHQTLEVA